MTDPVNEFASRCERILTTHESQRSIALMWLAREHPEIFEAAMAAMVDNYIKNAIDEMEAGL
jgi:hypothetical protein